MLERDSLTVLYHLGSLPSTLSVVAGKQVASQYKEGFPNLW